MSTSKIVSDAIVVNENNETLKWLTEIFNIEGHNGVPIFVWL